MGKKCDIIQGDTFNKAWPRIKNVACKIIDRRTCQRNFLEKFLPRELDIISKIRHPNIVQTYSIFKSTNRVYITMEYVNGGDLLKLIKSNGALTHSIAKRIFLQLSDAISYLHSERIAHRDIKCENILLDQSRNVKLCDFGFARYTYDKLTDEEVFSSTYCGSAAYAAPEILQGIPYDMKANDMWAMGVVLYTMVSGSMPFGERNAQRILQKQKARINSSVNNFAGQNPALQELLKGLLEYEPIKRLRIGYVYRSSWLKSNQLK
ncbi:hypothetical protein GJ496_000439 [Pomphorhynchus laevis]|nr:hypothetical protein GJ496_000439 [Pomphorhynchus laevis]